MRNLLGYTRIPMADEVYAARLAYSMHLALETEEGFIPLNHNSGVLFVKATEEADGFLNAKSLKNPWIFRAKDGSYGVLAVRTEADGEDDTENIGSIVIWQTEDFLVYKELGLLSLGSERITKARCIYDEKKETYRIEWQQGEESFCGNCSNPFVLSEVTDICPCDSAENSPKFEASRYGMDIDADDIVSNIPGAVPMNMISISDELADYLEKKLLTPVMVGTVVPEIIKASSKEAAEDIKIDALYSDGTTHTKKVRWDFSRVDFQTSGTYPVKGTLYQEVFPFPIAYNRADPCICRWQGSYYFIATNDADKEHTLYIRKADTLEGLITAEEHLILDSVTYPGIGGLLWAPEFHVIQDRLYIFHAATPEPFFCEESHIMELKEGGDPTCKQDWSAPKRIVKKDGSDLCEAGKTISLDMTHFVWEEEHYVVWSQRQFLPKDLGAWLYIAKLNPQKPWMLASDPVVLSKPDYGWDNNHTFVDEGPYALFHDDKLYLTFSGAAVDTTYVVSYLYMEHGKDLLVRENWRKNNYPILTSRSVEGEFGTGHNAYVTDEYGTVWNTYHARPGLTGVRSSGVRRVHFDIDGAPMLDVTRERDLPPALCEIETVLEVQ